MTKSHLYRSVPKRSVMVLFPNVWIVLPLAATNKAPGCMVLMAILVAGKTLTSTPVSTKTSLLKSCLLHTKQALRVAGCHSLY